MSDIDVAPVGAVPHASGVQTATPAAHQLPPPLPAARASPGWRAGRYQPLTPWTPWWGLGATALIGLLVVLFLAASGGILSVLYPQAFEHTGAAIPKLRLEQPAVAYGLSGVMLASQLFGVLLTLLFARAKPGRLTEVLALRAPIGGPWAYAWALPLFVVFGFGVGLLFQWLWPQSSRADTELMQQLTHSPAAWLIFAAAVVLAPMQEELIFRGFLFSALARARVLGFVGATILTSLGWAAIHGYSIIGDSTIFLLGLMLSFILWRTGSTRVTMACHGGYNALAFLAAVFASGAGG